MNACMVAWNLNRWNYYTVGIKKAMPIESVPKVQKACCWFNRRKKKKSDHITITSCNINIQTPSPTFSGASIAKTEYELHNVFYCWFVIWQKFYTTGQ